MTKIGFEPIIDENSKVLILGTFPSEKSLEKKEYYAHRSNQFWKIICEICGVSEPEAYAEKTRIILSNEFALWDVYRSISREGSADANIKNGIANDFSDLFDRYSNLKSILFGSKGAEAVFKNASPALYTAIPHLTAYSPSSAYPKRLSDKIENWRSCIRQLKELNR